MEIFNTTFITNWAERVVIAKSNFLSSFKTLIKVLLCRQTDDIDSNELVTHNENNQTNIQSNIRSNNITNTISNSNARININTQTNR